MEFGPAGIVGTDSAYIDNGYVYHTPFDRIDEIPDKTIKHTGENLVAFVSALSNAPQMDTEYSDEKYPREARHPTLSRAVFFDILGVFCVSYGCRMVFVLHYSVGAIGLAIAWSRSRESLRSISSLWSTFCKKMAVFLISVFGTVIVGLVYAAVAPMRWYNHGLPLALLAYVAPAIAFYEIGQRYFFGLQTVEENHRAGLIFISGIVLIGTSLGILTTHVS
jgi:hypothetical protein